MSTRIRRARHNVFVVGGVALLVVVLGTTANGLTLAVTPAEPQILLTDVANVDGVAFSAPHTTASAVGFADQLSAVWTAGTKKSVPIASIAKTVTALVVLDRQPIADPSSSPIITFTDDDVAIQQSYQAQNGVTETVTPGMQLTEYEALELMLMKSANNIAASVAIWAFGSIDAYLDAAQSWLDTHDLAQTHIADPAGMNPATVASSANLVVIGGLVMADPLLSTIVGQTQARIPGVGTITTTNPLLPTGTVTGIKTGTLAEAGYCLLFAVPIAALNTVAVGVVLGATSKTTLVNSASRLVQQINANVNTVTLTTAGETAAQYAPEWASSAPPVTATVSATESVTVFGPTQVSSVVDLKALTGGEKAGESVGTVSYTVVDLRGTQTIEVPIALDTDVPEPDLLWRISRFVSGASQ